MARRSAKIVRRVGVKARCCCANIARREVGDSKAKVLGYIYGCRSCRQSCTSGSGTRNALTADWRLGATRYRTWGRASRTIEKALAQQSNQQWSDDFSYLLIERQRGRKEQPHGLESQTPLCLIRFTLPTWYWVCDGRRIPLTVDVLVSQELISGCFG